MTQQPEVAAIRAFLARASRRVTLLQVLHGITMGFAVALMISIIMWIRHGVFAPPGIESLGLVGSGVAIGLVTGRVQRARIATIVEGQAPECRNVIVTASELIGAKLRTNEYVTGLVYRDAAALAESLHINTLFPLRGALTSVAIAAAAWTFAATRHPAAEKAGVTGTGSGSVAPAIDGVDASILLPAYVGETRPVLHDPARIEAFVGSRIQLTVRAHASSVTIETLHGTDTLHSASGDLFTGEVPADADGFIAFEPKGADGIAGPRRLIGVSVVADQAPRVHITAPGKDIKLANGHHTIDLTIESDDDLGLASLRLRYTRVSGSGERFTFTEGDVPLAIAHKDKRTWTAKAAWRLDSLALDAGDMVVYRAVAADFRPGAAATESDSYIAEVVAPGGVAAAGFALDPEIERYALSEQMVVLKTERLAARQKSMTADSFADAAADIASEQRRVRAEFVFMMGGEVGAADDQGGDLNEVAETEAEGDLAAGRMLNQGRIALMSAIRLMSRADKALTVPDLTLALTHERAALLQLERTFAHNRIILRAFTERESLDMTRRLGGALTDAASNAEPATVPVEDQRLLTQRNILSDIAMLSRFKDSAATTVAKISKAAERILRVDPSSKPGQQAASQLDSAVTAFRGARREVARELLDHAATTIARIIRAEVYDAPAETVSAGAARLAGALTDALRRRP